MEKGKEEIYKKLTEIAKKVEEFGLTCIVVDNPFRAERKEGVGHCFIVTQPGEEMSKEEFMDLFDMARNSCKEMLKTDCLLLDFGPIALVESIESWFNFLDSEDGRNKHPVLHGFPYGATDFFLSKVVYGKEAHEKIIRAFQNKHGKNFIQECYSVWSGEQKRRKNVLDDSNAKLKNEIEERKKPLNKFETEEINDFLLDCLKFSAENKISAIVGIDRSGRPLAQMLLELLEKIGYNPLPEIDFLDPHQLTKAVLYERIDKVKVPDVFVEKFKEEFPAIFRLCLSNPQSVLFVDDQVFSHFHTATAIRQLLKQAAQKENLEFNFRVVSGFNGYNGFTWWKDKRFLRIISNENYSEATLRSVPRKIGGKEEKKVKAFETKLSEIVETVSNTWKIQNENCLAVR